MIKFALNINHLVANWGRLKFLNEPIASRTRKSLPFFLKQGDVTF